MAKRRKRPANAYKKYRHRDTGLNAYRSPTYRGQDSKDPSCSKVVTGAVNWDTEDHGGKKFSTVPAYNKGPAQPVFTKQQALEVGKK